MRITLTPILLLLAPLATAGDTVVPNVAPGQAGTGAYSTLLHSGARSYQLVVGPEELGGIPSGASITGISWRRPTWIAFGDWPGTGFTCSWTNYDIYLSTSNNPPGSLSTTYTDNIGADVVQVRSGPLDLVDVHFPGGAVTPATNPFGMTLQFQTPYVYAGGDLLLTIRHTGNNCGGNGSLDTVGSPFTQAIGQSSYTDPDNWYNQGLIVMRLEFDAPASAFTNYCFSTINSSGSPSTISATGSASIAANDLTLSSGPMAPTEPGIYYYGGAQIQVPFGNGNRCVGGTVFRLSPSQAAGGVLTRPVDNTNLPMGGDFSAGATVNFQAWFRDPAGGGSGFNLSDGLSVVFAP